MVRVRAGEPKNPHFPIKNRRIFSPTALFNLIAICFFRPGVDEEPHGKGVGPMPGLAAAKLAERRWEPKHSTIGLNPANTVESSGPYYVAIQ